MQSTAEHILVVDDDDDIRQLVVTLLKRKGYIVKGLPDIDIQTITDTPCLFVLDVLLSGKNGKDICRALKQKESTKNIPVVMMSALTDARKECIAAGASDFIAKPFSINEFATCIQHVLEHSSPVAKTNLNHI